MSTNDKPPNHPAETYALLLWCPGGSAPAVTTLRHVLKHLIRCHRIKCLAGVQVVDEETGREALRQAAKPTETGAEESAA